jgi:hypothetical protein
MSARGGRSEVLEDALFKCYVGHYMALVRDVGIGRLGLAIGRKSV